MTASPLDVLVFQFSLFVLQFPEFYIYSKGQQVYFCKARIKGFFSVYELIVLLEENKARNCDRFEVDDMHNPDFKATWSAAVSWGTALPWKRQKEKLKATKMCMRRECQKEKRAHRSFCTTWVSLPLAHFFIVCTSDKRKSIFEHWTIDCPVNAWKLQK